MHDWDGGQDRVFFIFCPFISLGYKNITQSGNFRYERPNIPKRSLRLAQV